MLLSLNTRVLYIPESSYLNMIKKHRLISPLIFHKKRNPYTHDAPSCIALETLLFRSFRRKATPKSDLPFERKNSRRGTVGGPRGVPGIE